MEAVVSASHGAVQILLGKLGNVLATKYTLLSGVRGEIQELKDELESMTACLLELADGDDHNEQTRTWMKQVREVAFDVEDCMDRFCHHLSEHHGDRKGLLEYLHRMFNMVRTLRVRHTVATDIQGLKSRAQKVSERRRRYDLGESAGRSSKALDSSSYSHHDNLDRWLPAIHGDGSGLVGMGNMTHAVVRLLSEKRQAAAGPRVLSIVGFGGLGKTTLATTIYSTPKLGGIQCRAFIPVSQTYDFRSLLESVLKQLSTLADSDKDDDPLRNIKKWTISDLVDKIKQCLKRKRYLIVLDDVWQAAAWDQLKVAFPHDNGEEGSILITTRSHEVAKNCCTSPNDPVYEMKRLQMDDSEKLFFKTVFESGKCPNDLLKVSNAILARCNGLPLAIVSIARMLARRQNKTSAEWQTVCDRLGSELEINPTLEGMRRILALSYNDLPYHLKACFLYLCAFPEDFEVRRGSLIRRWAAEGLISGRYGHSLEEIAQNYLDEFVSRNIVSPEQIGCSGKIKSCKVHDIMLEVITAKSVKENFISFLGSSQYNTTAGHDKVRRLSIHPGVAKEQITFSSKNIVHTRSLTILDCIEKPVPIKFAELTLLRVLDLEGCGWLSDKDLKDICKLSLLRYLSLRKTTISQLPNAVGKLKELVTLDVRETPVVEFPKGITRLQNLNHLLVGRYAYYTRTRSVKRFGGKRGAKVPLGLGNMVALQRISHVDISTQKSSCAMHELEKLRQLTRLCVINKNEAKFWKPFAKSLNVLSTSLRYLMVLDGSEKGEELEFLVRLKAPPLFLQRLHLGGRLTKLPDWVSSLNNLASLSLRETHHLAEDSFEVLGKLPSLVSLKLYFRGYAGSALCFEEDSFPRLKQLVVDNQEYLQELSFHGGSPNLERLTLAFSRVPRGGINGIENLLCLREVEFFGHIIDSTFNEVFEAAKIHPNRPKVTRDDQPSTEAAQASSGVGYSEQQSTNQQVDRPALRREEDDEAAPAWRLLPSKCPLAYIL
ncbi:hypothetical protein CFC21_013617 [Triticum aestivum]|uniref:Uncharacterized protein n=2 Tax=Triticum aestivum TaxID=4565 RepID=A0A9R1DSI9_WHEAT|nr:disease resistance protein Pik-2-like [Triticum aestivum]KAF6997398.1 hypothetical protein CFC21_013617 [Triticum aestivum]